MIALEKWRTLISQKLQKEYDFAKSFEECAAQFVTGSWMQGETLQKACNMSIVEIEMLYAEAYAFYQDHQCSESEELFRLLVTLDPFIHKYWLGLSASMQMQGKYEEALKCYGAMAILDETSPTPYFYASECLEKLNRSEESKEAWNFANKLMSLKNV